MSGEWKIKTGLGSVIDGLTMREAVFYYPKEVEIIYDAYFRKGYTCKIDASPREGILRFGKEYEKYFEKKKAKGK